MQCVVGRYNTIISISTRPIPILLLYRIAMDVLPVQASSVSSERVFSSSKMTCTAERNRLSVQTMEALQVLKHALDQRRRDSPESEVKTLDFVSRAFESLELKD